MMGLVDRVNMLANFQRNRGEMLNCSQECTDSYIDVIGLMDSL